MRLTVTALNVFPVKSLRGIGVSSGVLTPLGLEYDRLWMLVTPSGRFLTQRELPRMALIQTRLMETGVELCMDGHGAVQLPFTPRDGQPINTAVWGDACHTIDQGEEVSRWLGEALASREAPRVVRMAGGYRRPQRRPERYGAEVTTVFADGAPYLVANEASLAQLNAELQQRGLPAVPMDRFRANIVVSGLPAFAEHEPARFSGPGYELDLRYPCERCSITTVDQQRGVADPGGQPWRTLVEINPMPGNSKAPAFAQNSLLRSGAGARISVGDMLQKRG